MANAFTLDSIKIDVDFNGKKAQIGLKQLSGYMKQLQGSGLKVNNVFGKLFKGAGIAGAILGLSKMAINASELGRSLGLISDNTGIATSKLSQMRNAFTSAGIQASSLDNALTSISDGLAGLSFGEGAMASKLAALNISAWENGRIKTSDKVLMDIARWTKNQKDLGRDMREISAYLKKSFGFQQDVISKLAEGEIAFDASKTGYLYGFQVENLGELNKSYNTFKTTLSTLFNQISADFAPMISGVFDVLSFAFRELQDIWNDIMVVFEDVAGDVPVIDWLVKGLKEVVKSISYVLKFLLSVFEVIALGLRKIGEFFGNIVAWIANKFGFLGGKTDDPDFEKYQRQIAEIKNPELKQKRLEELSKITNVAGLTGIPPELLNRPIGKETSEPIYMINQDNTVAIYAGQATAEEIQTAQEQINKENLLDMKDMTLDASTAIKQ